MTNPANELARRTADAYMAEAYGETEWESCAQELLNRGLNEAEAEAFLRSKHMRWADDWNSGEARTADGLRAYLASEWFRKDLRTEARELVAMS